VTRITHKYQHKFTENSLKFATYFVENDAVLSGKWFPTYRRNYDHLQGSGLDKAARMHDTLYIRLSAVIMSALVRSQTLLALLDCTRYVRPKRRQPLTQQHAVTSQKTCILITLVAIFTSHANCRSRPTQYKHEQKM
jgi:hypothetical protein